MALTRRSQRFNTSIWPGFVDAMTGLLLVLMFVLTIFMVIQFVLREKISGQEDQLNTLSSEITALASALGLEQQRTQDLNTALDIAAQASDQQSSLIDRLILQRDEQTAALGAANDKITGFEAQVAGLLADQQQAQDRIATLEGTQATLMSQQEALNLALASARDEVDAGQEAARLAAARRTALEALIADLRTSREADVQRISDLEAAQLADAAAAEALRNRLENADTELTAMTLALEEKRREAEDTLTLLAASQSARDELSQNLAAALLAQQQAESDRDVAQQSGTDLDARLAAALAEQEITAAALAAAQTTLDTANTSRAEIEAQLAAALLAQQGAQATQADLEARLAEALLARDALQREVAGVTEDARTRAEIEAELAAALAARDTNQTEAARQASLLAVANETLTAEKALSAESQRQVALLNEQIAALRSQVGTLQSLLDVANDSDTDAQVRIETLGAQLNTALARVAAEERRRATLEEAERLRLEEEARRLTAETQNLERFRSDFFGRLRDVLEGQDGVRIDGDRFVFSSEVLFAEGQADLSDPGRAEIDKVAVILRRIANEIPPGIDWVIRVDGHTDNQPLSGFGEYRDNWELSQARALSVVRYMSESLGIPPNRLAANGFGEYQPINPADTPEARAQNRRIELKLTER
jgi:chemotaxis protein MotB